MKYVEEFVKSVENRKNLGNQESACDININEETTKIIEIFREMENVENIYGKPECSQDFQNFKKSCENVKIVEISETVHFSKEKRKVPETLYPHELLYKTGLGGIFLCFLIGITLSIIINKISKFLIIGEF